MSALSKLHCLIKQPNSQREGNAQRVMTLSQLTWLASVLCHVTYQAVLLWWNCSSYCGGLEVKKTGFNSLLLWMVEEDRKGEKVLATLSSLLCRLLSFIQSPTSCSFMTLLSVMATLIKDYYIWKKSQEYWLTGDAILQSLLLRIAGSAPTPTYQARGGRY